MKQLVFNRNLPYICTIEFIKTSYEKNFLFIVFCSLFMRLPFF